MAMRATNLATKQPVSLPGSAVITVTITITIIMKSTTLTRSEGGSLL
jgi:hypothetical protein